MPHSSSLLSLLGLEGPRSQFSSPTTGFCTGVGVGGEKRSIFLGGGGGKKVGTTMHVSGKQYS